MKQNLFKPILLAIAVLIAVVPLQAQGVSNNNDDEVNKVDQYAQRYRPGQVIVKFRENSPVNIKSENGMLKGTGVGAIDKVMTTLGVTEAQPLMPLTGDIKNCAPRKAKALSGREIIEPNLSKLYCLKFEETEERNVLQAVEMLKCLNEVEFAEPNYLAFIQSTEESTTYQAEPMFSEQWGLNAINMPQLWAMPKADETRPIIAILDTGVDITHPDLADNIWANPNEANGADYEDDDNNGYVDDVHGWDFIAGTAIIGNGMDRNGHGTHCAGIAAAVGNNGIGITGANPDALILPIKVMGDDGTGDVATICRGIDYAAACGANVLSMSFGSRIPSGAMYQSLCKILTNYAVLVGAAGNVGYSIYSDMGLSFPGAYDIVLGVMASNSDGQLAGFSNYDPDGPFFSKYNYEAFSSDVTWNDEAMWNYDLMAPGVGILSTFLNGSYKSLNGTSMATPMVAGAISRILQVKGYDYARDYGLMGDMAVAKDGGLTDFAVFNAYQAASYDETNRQVALALTALEIDDSDGDGDGRFDAGETISLWPTIRSLWGHAENIKIAIEPYDDNVPTDALEVLNNNVDFGWSLNSRGSFKSKNPIRVRVNENANDGLHLPYKIVITSDNLLANIEQEHVFEVENCIEIKGIISEDMVLYPDKKYVVTQPAVFQTGKTLTIKSGAKLELKSSLEIKGYLVCNGTSDSIIIIKNTGGYDHFGHSGCKIRTSNSATNTFVSYTILDETVIDGPNLFLHNCIIKNGISVDWFQLGFKEKCNLFDLKTSSLWGGDGPLKYCNFIHNSRAFGYYLNEMATDLCSNIFNLNGIFKCSVSSGETYHFNNTVYFGSDNESVIRKNILDVSTDPGALYICSLDSYLHKPVKEAHGIVWKVVVDGYDAQDEFDQLPPLGVGRHKFDVYFNRDDMDTTITPMLAMGVRPPYTQIGIAEDGSWSIKDSVSVYTAFLTITGKLQTDGLNRIYVAGAQDGEHFEIPYENSRFNVLVQAAGSMATGFAAEAGLGNVKLTWNNENNDFEDAMGFNVYRFQLNAENDTINMTRLNETIIDLEDTEYIDYEVTPNETYYYYYKVLSTDLKEYDISNVVAATPLTSTLGDANASGDVDVADVITTVNYAAGMEPRPFIFEAADVNVDTEIDILDVIGIIKIITNPSGAPATASIESVAEYWVKNGMLWLDTPVDLAGLQVNLDAPQGSNITPTEELNGFEKVSTWLSDNDYLFLAYSMAGRTLEAGRHPILFIGDHEIADIRLSDANGHNVMATPSIVTAVETINVDGKPAVAEGIYDLMGRKISSKASDLNRLPHGIYIVNGVKVVK